jgi:DNA repair exonuclease SbcCD nuclease subunit
MIRLLHTADWQIGLKAGHVARAGDAVREARFEAARTVVAQAGDDRSDALILAGDIFEDNHVDNQWVREVVRILSASSVPVYVLPGNHDPLSQDSIYRRASWKERAAHVHLLETTEPVPIAQGRALLLPAPLSLRKSAEDPTLALRIPELGRAPGPLIGVAHGSLKIEGKHGRDDFPIALDTASRGGLQYLALGHWHGRYVHGDRTAYSGTLETTKFGEDGSGFALRVSLAESGSAAPQIEELRCGRLSWLTRDLRLEPGGSDLEFKALRNELEALLDAGSKTLLRVRTSGESDAETLLKLRALEEDLSPRFLYFELDRRDLPSHVIRGRTAEMAAKNPFVASLFSSLGAGEGDPDLQSVAPEELLAARQLLTELITDLDGPGSRA